MRITYYGLPLFLGRGEGFNYCNNILEGLLNYSEEIDFTVLKEKDFFTGVNSKAMMKALNLKNSILNMEIENRITIDDLVSKSKMEEVKVYHCLNNGFSINEEVGEKKIATIYTTLPLTDGESLDNEYNLKYIREIQKASNLCEKLIVPTGFMKEELSNFLGNEDKIEVIPPGINTNFIGQSKLLSKAYVLSKYNIRDEYCIYVGEINNRNNLIETINLFKEVRKEKNIKLVLAISYLNKNKSLLEKLLFFIDKLNLSEEVIFLKSPLFEEIINLINGATAFINLNPCEEINITQIYAMMLNTKIITYGNQSNYEYLENYPVYISSYLDGAEKLSVSEECASLDGDDKSNIFYISKKFDQRAVAKRYLSIYCEGE